MTIDLLAGCWTTAGNAGPSLGNEISPNGLVERIEITSAAGFCGMGFVLADLSRAREEIGLPNLRKILEINGIKHVEVEFLSDWWTSGADRAVSDQTRKFLFEAAMVLGAHHVKVGADYRMTSFDLDQMAEQFSILATEAAEVGTKIAIEFMPFSNVPDLKTGLALVNTASHPAGGLMIDIWHVQRSNTTYAELACVPLERVIGVEVNDASAAQIGDSFEDTIMRRVPCGLGQFDIKGFIETLWNIGWRGPWGVEIIGEEFRNRPISEAIPEAFNSTMREFQTLRNVSGLQ